MESKSGYEVLQERYNSKFIDRFCGFEVLNGWHNLIKQLFEDLEKSDWQGQVIQIKEKFGGLRFYVDGATDEQYKLINAAEDKSYEICEVCGEVGIVRKGGWVRTLCDVHEAERIEYQKQFKI